jgi:hypothetical protein
LAAYPYIATFARTVIGYDYRAIEHRERGPPSAWNAAETSMRFQVPES